MNSNISENVAAENVDNEILKSEPDNLAKPQKFERTIGTKAEVWNGVAKRTSGGLKKEDLTLNKSNKVVSKKRSEHGYKFQGNLRHKKKSEPIKLEENPPESLLSEPEKDQKEKEPVLEASKSNAPELEQGISNASLSELTFVASPVEPASSASKPPTKRGRPKKNNT